MKKTFRLGRAPSCTMCARLVHSGNSLHLASVPIAVGDMAHNLLVTNHTRLTPRRRAALPHLGNLVLGKILHAVTGTRRLPVTFKNRAAANGIRAEVLDALFRKTRNIDSLRDTFSMVSQNQWSKALYWSEVGVKTRARDHYLESALWGMHAALLMPDSSAKWQLIERCQWSYAQAAPYFVYPTQAVEIPYLTTTVKGYLRLPVVRNVGDASEPASDWADAGTNHPCVILFNGFGLPKEELHLTENAFLAAGIATLSFDYPDGRYDSNAASLFAFDAVELVEALYFFLAGKLEIDAQRVGLYGMSLGGRVALSAAAANPTRYRAVCTLSAPVDLTTDMDLIHSTLLRQQAITPNFSKGQMLDFARRTPLKEQMPNLQAPVLIAGGGKDLTALAAETKELYELCNSSDKKLLVCPSAGHNCYEMMPSLRHEIAQWLRHRM